MLRAGFFFAAELALGFHVGFVATSSGRRREIMDGRHVALYYMRHGTFAQDLLSTLIWLVQVCALAVRALGGGSLWICYVCCAFGVVLSLLAGLAAPCCPCGAAVPHLLFF
jgi:hypothetical protein